MTAVEDTFLDLTAHLSFFFPTKAMTERELIAFLRGRVTNVDKKVMVLLMSEETLRSRTFRKIVLQCLSINVDVIALKDKQLSSDAAVGHFKALKEPNIRGLRKILSDAVVLGERSKSALLTQIIDRIKGRHGKNERAMPSTISRPKRRPSKGYSVCAIKQDNECLHVFSYNLMKSQKQLPNVIAETVAIPGETQPRVAFTDKATVDIRISSSGSCTPPSPTNQSRSEPLTDDSKAATSQPHPHAWQKAPETNRLSARHINRRRSSDNFIPLSLVSNLRVSFGAEVTGEDAAEGQRNGRRPSVASFERVCFFNRTYAVCKPQRRNDNNTSLLYVNFPNDLSRMQWDSSSDLRRSSSESNSSAGGFDLSTPFAMHSESSPIHSPPPQILIYTNPLPAFPEAASFPPLKPFPCEDLQRRRKSIFNVLDSPIHHLPPVNI